MKDMKQALRKLGCKVGQQLKDEDGTFGYFCEVPLSALMSAAYQRGLSNTHVTNIRQRFIHKAALPLCVSYRDGKLWVFDGQHRSQVLLSEGFGSHYAYVYCGMSYDEEAQMFFELNDTPRKMGGWAKFKAAYNAGNTTYHELIKIADRMRLTTPMTPGVSKVADADIKSPIYLTWPLSKGGYPLVEAVCRVLDKCWRVGGRRTPVQTDAKDTAIIRGLATFLKGHYLGSKPLPWSTVEMVLKSLGPTGLIQEAAKSPTKRIDYKQYNEALCRTFGLEPIKLNMATTSCHLRRAA